MSYWIAGATVASAVIGSQSGKKGAAAAKKSAKQQMRARQDASNMLGKFSTQLTSDYSPYAALGQQYMPEMRQAASVEGLGNRFQDVLTNPAFDPLRAERMDAATAQLANTGLSRSGQALREVANVPTNLAMELEGLITQRQGGLFNMGWGAQQALTGGLGNIVSQQANIRAGIGDAQSQGTLGAAQANAAGTQSAMNSAWQGLGMYGAKNGWFNQGGGTASSDRRLKTNIKQKGVMSSGLPFYEYTIFGRTEVGVMAQEAALIFPDAVCLDANGYLMVDYSGIY
jgi:hypothetical protein